MDFFRCYFRQKGRNEEVLCAEFYIYCKPFSRCSKQKLYSYDDYKIYFSLGVSHFTYASFLQLTPTWLKVMPCISERTDWNTMYTTPDKFENAALFLPFNRSTLSNQSVTKAELLENVLETERIWKGLWKPFSFSCGRKHFENGALGKRWRHDNHVCFPDRIFFLQYSKMIGDIAFINSCGRPSMDGRNLMRFNPLSPKGSPFDE